MFRLLKERLGGIPSIHRMQIPRMITEPSILAMTIHTGSTDKESENFKTAGYVSARGESVCNLVNLFLSYNDVQIQPLIR